MVGPGRSRASRGPARGGNVFTAVCYDIPDDRRRARIAQVLQDFGRRAQRSVFEADLSQAAFDRLVRRLRRIVEPAEDSVRAYRLCEVCRDRVLVLCGPAPYREPQALVVGRAGPTRG